MSSVPGNLPISLVIGSPVYGSKNAPWDAEENKFTAEQLEHLIHSTARRTNKQRFVIALLMPVEMCFALKETMNNLCFARSEIVYVHFKNMAPQNGPFYPNRLVVQCICK